MFCVLYACTACCLAVLDVVLHTSYGTLPFRCLSLATHGRGSFSLLFPHTRLGRAAVCLISALGHAGWAAHVIHLCLGTRTQRVFFFWFAAVA